MTDQTTNSTTNPHDPYLALRFRDFRLLLAGNVISGLSGQMIALAVGWELYERTNSALALGLVGLVQLLPLLVLSVFTGYVADRFDRKKIVMYAQTALAVAAFGLAVTSQLQGTLVVVYGCLLLRGVGAAFDRPAAGTLPADVVPPEAYENSASWSNGLSQAASIAGPALGGLLIALFGSTAPIYALGALGGLVYVALLLLIRGYRSAERLAARRAEKPTLRSLGDGVRFLRRTQIVLAAMTLDLFAVLLGGATALMPIFAKDILMVGPIGLGWLQSAPAIGALLVAVFLAHRPPLQRAGPTLLLGVAGFGAVTIGFGLSQSFWISLACLLALGGADCINMVVRDTLVLTRVPDAMRGRVAAIEGVFTHSSNQLGGFESGLTAQLFGPMASVVGGGVGTIVVVLIIAAAWPALRNLRTLREATA